MASRYKFLASAPIDLATVWAWAKQLVTDLNKQDYALTASMSGAAPTGGTMFWLSDTIPAGWLLCDGGQHAVADYPVLFNEIGYRYGGSGDFFNVPDMRDRMLMGAGTLVALNSTAGAANAQLAVNNMPEHSHGVTDPQHTHTFTGTPHTHAVTDPQHTHGITDPGHVHSGGSAAPTNSMTAGAASNSVGQANTGSATTGITVNAASTGITNQNATAGGANAPASTGITIQNTGGGEAFSVLNPVFGINVIIKA